MPEEITTVKRTRGPWGWGLAGYDIQGALKLVVVTNPKNGAKWMRARVTKRDLERVQTTYSEMKASPS